MVERIGTSLRTEQVGPIYDLLEPIAGARLLEVGGHTALHLGEAVARGARAWGVGPSADVLRAARGDAPEADLRLGCLPDLPFDSASFDIVCVFDDAGSGAAETVRPDSASEVLTELMRVCRPGGRVVLAGPSMRRLCELGAGGRTGLATAVYPATLVTGVVILER